MEMKAREQAEVAAEQLPQRLKAARKSAGITQDELVAIAEFSPVALSKFERGINSPSFKNLVAICHALEVSPNFLTGWDEDGAGSDGDGAEKRLLLNRLMLAADGLSEDWILQLISIAEKAETKT